MNRDKWCDKKSDRQDSLSQYIKRILSMILVCYKRCSREGTSYTVYKWKWNNFSNIVIIFLESNINFLLFASTKYNLSNNFKSHLRSFQLNWMLQPWIDMSRIPFRVHFNSLVKSNIFANMLRAFHNAYLLLYAIIVFYSQLYRIQQIKIIR